MDLAATVLGSAPSGDQPLMEAGLDSLGAVDLRNAVSSAFGVELPPTATLDYPTVDALTQFIVGSMAPAASSALVDPGHWSDDLDAYGEPKLAPTHIIGLSCIYPGKLRVPMPAHERSWCSNDHGAAWATGATNCLFPGGIALSMQEAMLFECCNQLIGSPASTLIIHTGN